MAAGVCVEGCDPVLPGEGGITETAIEAWLVRGGGNAHSARRRAHILWHRYCAGPEQSYRDIAAAFGVSDAWVHLLRDRALRHLRMALTYGRLTPDELPPGTRLYQAVVRPPLGSRLRQQMVEA